jgi:hypothetical protein
VWVCVGLPGDKAASMRWCGRRPTHMPPQDVVHGAQGLAVAVHVRPAAVHEHAQVRHLHVQPRLLPHFADSAWWWGRGEG